MGLLGGVVVWVPLFLVELLEFLEEPLSEVGHVGSQLDLAFWQRGLQDVDFVHLVSHLECLAEVVFEPDEGHQFVQFGSDQEH